MKKTLEYLSKKNQELISTNYGDENCRLIAVETASKLIEDGLNPHVETVYEEITDDKGDYKIKSLFPKPLIAKEWVIHHVCCTEDEAFDPLIGRPVSKSEYCQILFGEPIAMKQTYSKEKILRLHREKKMKWIIYNLDKEKYVLPICESCLAGGHFSYGNDHRSGDSDRSDCKNTEKIGSETFQCLCSEKWPGLYDTIEKGIEKVYDTESNAKDARLELLAGEEGK